MSLYYYRKFLIVSSKNYNTLILLKLIQFNQFHLANILFHFASLEFLVLFR